MANNLNAHLAKEYFKINIKIFPYYKLYYYLCS